MQSGARTFEGRWRLASMEDLATLFMQPATWIALVTLIAMEVVLGIDNLIFISILTNKLPENVRERARKIGRSEEHTSELQSLMRISYAVFCLKKKNKNHQTYE